MSKKLKGKEIKRKIKELKEGVKILKEKRIEGRKTKLKENQGEGKRQRT